jgi:hypothetical protein
MQCLVDLYEQKISTLECEIRATRLPRECTSDMEAFCSRVFHHLSIKKINKVGRDSNNNLRESFENYLLHCASFRCFYDPSIPFPVFCDPQSQDVARDAGARTGLGAVAEREAPVVALSGDTATSPATRNVVLNPFKCSLSTAEINLLNRGLNFCPTSQPNQLNIYKSLSDLERKLKLRYHYYRPPVEQNDDTVPHVQDAGLSAFHREIPSNSSFVPDTFDKAIPTFIRCVREEVERDLVRSPATLGRLAKPRHNLRDAECRAMSSLRKRDDIVIKPSDKGNCVVILPADVYRSKCLEQLSDQKYYEEVSLSRYEKLKLEVRSRIRAIADELDTKVLNYLLTKDPKPGRFYGLVKIHKEGWPLRPIVSGNSTLTEHCSHLLDFLLKGILPRIDTYVKDSDHFQAQIKDLCVPQDAFLVTIDVRSLYTNIPCNAGIEAAIRAYRELLPTEEQHVSDRVLRALLEIVLHYNLFEFDGKLYIQKYGTAMGTKAAPSYASIFLALFEKRFLGTQEKQPFFLCRFLDDLFSVWPHDRSSLESFLHDMNEFHPDIKITYNISQQSVNFLDMTIRKERDGSLATTIYRKPTDAPGYLEFFSEHPAHVKRAIPYGIATRIARRCTSTTERDRNLSVAREHLVSRKYPAQLVDDAFHRVTLPETRRRSRSTAPPDQNPVNFVVPFSSGNPRFQQIIQKHLPVLRQNAHLQRVFSERPIRLVYTRPKNLRDVLVHSKMPANRNTGLPVNYAGSGPCNGRSDCRVCTQMPVTKEVVSRDKKFHFQIRGSFNCNSQNIVYMLACGHCGLQYIGETCRKLRERFNDHKSKSDKHKYPIGRHVITTGHPFENFFAVVLKGGFSSENERKLFESFLILRFNTVQNGLNDDSGVIR